MKNTLCTIALLLVCAPVFAQRSGSCLGIAAGSAEKNQGKFDTVFSAKEIIDVDLTVLFNPGVAKRFDGDHEVEVRIFTPNGSLYQSIAVPFSNEKGREGKPKKLAGYPREIPTKALTVISDNGQQKLGVAVRLPVGGTSISLHSLWGQWSARAYVDGEALPCAADATFTITE
jgi:hypothetical protein